MFTLYQSISSVIRKPVFRTCIRRVGCLTGRVYPYSYMFKSSSEPLVNWTVGQMLDHSAIKYRDREAFVFCHQKIRKTVRQVKSDADKLGSGFLAIGLKPGNLIGIWSLNCYEWITTQYAAAKCGLILVHINPVYQPREMLYCLTKVPLQCLIASDTFKTLNYYEILRSLIPNLPTCKKGCLKAESFPELTHVVMMSEKEYPGTWKYKEIFEAGGSAEMKELEDLQFQIQADTPSNIMFTSGTTGFPKAAVVTHHALVNNAGLAGKRLMLEGDQIKAAIPLPLFHIFGLGVGSITPLVCGYCAIFPSPAFHADAVAQVIQAEKCTTVFGTPLMIMDLFNDATYKKYDFSSLRYVVSGGAAISPDIATAISKQLNRPLVIGYGATETTCAISVAEITDPREIQVRKGMVLDHTEVKIVDTAGNIVPCGIRGEIWVRGYSVMKEYWGEPDNTIAAITENRWYRTGDIGVMDENGYLEIVSRIKEMINRGGENVYPREVEDLLYTHPKIADVQVIGVPDKRYGEVVCAWIIVKSGEEITEDEVKEFCRGQLARFKVPKYVMFVKTFPKTATGKIQKYTMQEETVKKLGLKK